MFIPTPNRNERLLKYALAGLGATLVLALLSALYFDVKPPVRSGQEETKQEAALSPEAELKLQEQVSPLIKAGDMKACERVDNAMYRSVCVNNIALQKAEETGDISFCQYLDDELISRDSCERQILFPKSIEKEDKAICGETKNATLRKECEDSFLFGLANKKQDPSLCDQDSDTINADRCWNAYHVQGAMAPTSDGKRQSLDCSLLRGDDVKADCAAIAPALENRNPQKLAESCQARKTEVFGLICMMALQQSTPGAGQAPQTP